MAKIHDVRQGSDEWQMLRIGIPCASEFKNIITPAEGKFSKASRNYAYKLVAEVMLKRPVISASTQWMDRGNILEADAVQAYEFSNDIQVKRVGFITDDLHHYGCSPDFIVGDDGLGEVKCLSETNHIEFLVEQKIDPSHKPQVQGQLFITGREWVDWYGYYPGLPSTQIRTYRDEDYIAKLESCLEQFRDVMSEMIERMIQRGHIEIEPSYTAPGLPHGQTIWSAG